MDGGSGGSGANAGGSGGAVTEQEPFFQGLGRLNDDYPDSYCYGVSADGTTAVGSSTVAQYFIHAFRWNDGAMTDLGTAFEEPSTAVASNEDGSRLAVGVGSTFPEAGIWAADAGIVGIGMLGNYSIATDMSADGTTVVGYTGVYVVSPYSQTTLAFRWTAEEGMVDLGKLPGTTQCSPNGTNDDGSVVVGICNVEAPPPAAQAFVWRQGNGMVALEPVTATQAAAAYGVSGDGKVVVGSANSGGSNFPATWDETGALTLVTETSTLRYGSLTDVNGDGSVAIGHVRLNGTYQPVIWDAVHGLRSITTLLSELSLLPDGWVLTSAKDISRDGKVIVGYGTNPAGRSEGWIARLP